MPRDRGLENPTVVLRVNRYPSDDGVKKLKLRKEPFDRYIYPGLSWCG